MIVGIEEKERYGEVVEEVVKRLEENNLYIKPEKCKWKIKEIRFFISSNWAKQDQDRKRKGKSSSGMASP